MQTSMFALRLQLFHTLHPQTPGAAQAVTVRAVTENKVRGVVHREHMELWFHF